MLDNTLIKIKRFIPRSIFTFFQPPYHWTLAFLAALVYRFPAKKLTVIAVTGTKGKSSTVEILNAILEQAGYKTAVSNTIRFKIADHSEPNLYKMSMPGRFSMQRFLRKAADTGCEYAVMEMTSQGSLLFRHLFIDLDALVFTNLSPEHIEAHGSYENYIKAKLAIAQALVDSTKPNKYLVANGDDKEAVRFLSFDVKNKITFKIKDAEPYEIKKEGLLFTLNGKTVTSPLSGLFNLYNILGAIKAAQAFGVNNEIIVQAIEKFGHIPGRVQIIEGEKVPGVKIVIDYAHTPDSLQKFYEVFGNQQNICVLGGTGGGRDTWKRAKMGEIADQYCVEIILTNEDPYDEDPHKIVADVAAGIKSKKPQIIMDRRQAIYTAIKSARPGNNILITGKGTDPYIMGPNGSKTPWSDAEVAKEEAAKISNFR